MDDAAVRDEVQALDELLAQLEELPPGPAREHALAAVQGLLRVYGEALARVLAVGPPQTAAALQDDELVSQLLLLHDLHPATLDERIAGALEEVRPYMGSHGGGIELVGVSDGVARVRLQGTCSSCAASTVTLKLAVEEAILRAAPELRAVEAIEDAAVPGTLLPMFDGSGPAAPPAARWTAVDGLDAVDGDRPLRVEVDGRPLLFARPDGALLAYVDRCPACRTPIADPRLDGEVLRCGGCGRRYDLARAGVGADGGLFQLDPVPLLERDGRVRVAVEAVPA